MMNSHTRAMSMSWENNRGETIATPLYIRVKGGHVPWFQVTELSARLLYTTNLPGYAWFFQFLRNFCHQNACEQAGLILRAALDPPIARKARKGEYVKYLDHFDLLQRAIN
jgi:hypothetical protein